MNKTKIEFSWLIATAVMTVLVQCHVASAQDADPAALTLIESLSLRESAEPVRKHPRWAKPRKIAVWYRSGLGASRDDFEASMESVAGNAEVVVFERFDADIELIADADVLFTFCNPRLVRQLPRIRWVHSYGVGVDACLNDPEVRHLDFILSNNQRISAPSIAELAIGMALMLNKNMHQLHKAQLERRWAQRDLRLSTDISGKTMLILGLGGIGTETARRGSALGMRIIATRNSSREGPEFVDRVGLPDEMYELAGEADVVVNALPLTEKTNGLIDSKFFDALKPGAHYINVGRGPTTVTDDLVAALASGRLGGAGLDVTDPEPLPAEHPLWTADNVVITPHIAGRNSDAARRTMIIARENLRRYVQGEKLLNVVDRDRGY